MQFSVTLRLVDVYFPNDTLDNLWYNGNKNIHSLTFTRCWLQYVKPDSFDREAFNQLIYLTFKFRPDIEIEMGKMKSLQVLYIDGMRNVAAHFFDNIRLTIREFVVYRFPIETNLNNLFGRIKLSSLTAIDLFGIESNISRSLHASNFSQLPRIQSICLQQFNIESIHMNTFNLIGKMLVYINLSHNKLKSVQLLWFTKMFDTYTNLIRMLYLFSNPLKCNCEFYEWRNMTIYFNSYTNVHDANYLRTECINDDSDEFLTKCPNLQTISKEKIHFNESGINTYAYPRVDLRLKTDNFVLQTEFNFRYRILIRRYTRDEIRKTSKCFSLEWLFQSLNCFYLNGNKTHALQSSSLVNKNELTSIFIILIHPIKHAWPLHIQTFQLLDDNDYKITIVYWAGGGCMIFLAIIFTGYLLVWYVATLVCLSLYSLFN